MSARALLIEVRWPDGRFHGVREAADRARGGALAPEWPPSPFRLFQAMVAGAYGGRWVSEDDAEQKRAAFEWLEALPPPVISASSAHALRPVTYYVPNNDLDTKDGDPARVGEIRSAKVLRTSLFDAERPVAYLWTFEGDDGSARRMAGYAERLHTLGHGIDAAYARAEVLELAEAEARLAALGGAPRRPSRVGGGEAAPCPAPGSLESLLARHSAFRARLAQEGKGKKAVTRFRQPPKAHARSVAYDARPQRLVYELRPAAGGGSFSPWPQETAIALTTAVRDLLVKQLVDAGAPAEPVQRSVVGSKDAGPDDLRKRVRIVPLPSIGARHTDPGVRRVLVEVPTDCALSLADIRWALAGRTIPLAASAGAGVAETLLVPASADAMLGHYGVGERKAGRRWRTVTPAALPEGAARRRIDPARLAAKSEGEAKGGPERQAEEARAAAAVVKALRHAGVTARPLDIRVQREPFDLKGARAEAFATPDARFAKERLWHVEATFAEPVAGPLVIGDGRFCGLGLMRPGHEPPPPDLVSFSVASDHPLPPGSRPALIQAVRRALMSRADALGEAARKLFSGHEADGAPDRSGHHGHAYLFMGEAGGDLVLHIAAPWRIDRNCKRDRDAARAFAEVAQALRKVRAGRLGLLSLEPTPAEAGPFVESARAWRLHTPYRLDRHPHRGAELKAHAQQDMTGALARLGLPRAKVEIAQAQGAAVTEARVAFARPVRGPLLIGRDAHRGGGLLRPSDAPVLLD